MGEGWEFNLLHECPPQCSLCSWESPRFHTPGLFLLCGSIANQDSGEQVCSELTSQSREPKGPLEAAR